jgi:hypothetical protein
LPKAPPAVRNLNSPRRFPARLSPMKNINWKNIALIALVAVLVAVFIVPLVKPFLAKIPFLGKYVS